MDAESSPDFRVLILAPIGRDGELTSQLLGQARIPCHVCASARDVCVAFREAPAPSC